MANVRSFGFNPLNPTSDPNRLWCDASFIPNDDSAGSQERDTEVLSQWNALKSGRSETPQINRWNTRYARSWDAAISRDRNRPQKKEPEEIFKSDGAAIARSLIGMPPTISPERPSELGDYIVEDSKMKIGGSIAATPPFTYLLALSSCASKDDEPTYQPPMIDIYQGRDSGEALPDPATVDNDGDGFCEAEECSDGSKPGDCNDVSPAIFPGNFDFCDGIDNNCNEQVDEFGCGSLIYSTEEALKAFNLQTGQSRTLIEKRVPYGVTMALSPDERTLAFSTSHGEDVGGGYSWFSDLYFFNLEDNSLRKISFDSSTVGKMGWFDNERVLINVGCLDCGFSDLDYLIEGKMFFVDRNGNQTMARPDVPFDDIVIDAHNGAVIGFDYKSGEERSPAFFITWNDRNPSNFYAHHYDPGLPFLNDGWPAQNGDPHFGAVISRKPLLDPSNESYLFYFTATDEEDANKAFVHGQLFRYFSPAREREMILDLGEYRRSNLGVIKGVVTISDRQERLLLYRVGREEYSKTFCSILPSTDPSKVEESCVNRKYLPVGFKDTFFLHTRRTL